MFAAIRIPFQQKYKTQQIHSTSNRTSIDLGLLLPFFVADKATEVNNNANNHWQDIADKSWILTEITTDEPS